MGNLLIFLNKKLFYKIPSITKKKSKTQISSEKCVERIKFGNLERHELQRWTCPVPFGVRGSTGGQLLEKPEFLNLVNRIMLHYMTAGASQRPSFNVPTRDWNSFQNRVFALSQSRSLKLSKILTPLFQHIIRYHNCCILDTDCENLI